METASRNIHNTRAIFPEYLECSLTLHGLPIPTETL